MTRDIMTLVRPELRKIKAYSSARDEFGDQMQANIFLDANENPFVNGVNRYPDPYQRALKELISALKNVDSKNLILGNGSDEIIDLMIRSFCRPGIDNIICLPPTYGMYEVVANINAVGIKKVTLDQNFQPDVDGLLEKADENSKLLFLCSPNNPSGNSFEKEKVMKLLKEFSGIVIIDEAYIDFSNEASFTELLDEFPNLLVMQTLSKAYGMAGIRIGIGMGSEEIIQLLNKIKPPYNVNILSQQFALNRLKKQQDIQKEINMIKEEREKLKTVLSTFDFVEKVYPSDANFILLKVDDAHKRYTELIEEGIVVRNRSKLENCENCLRISIGTPEENNQLINSLKKLK